MNFKSKNTYIYIDGSLVATCSNISFDQINKMECIITADNFKYYEDAEELFDGKVPELYKSKVHLEMYDKDDNPAIQCDAICTEIQGDDLKLLLQGEVTALL